MTIDIIKGFLLAIALTALTLLVLGGYVCGQEAAPTPSPKTAEEWWHWFEAQDGAVIKNSQVKETDNSTRPLEQEITLKDPKLLPEGIWGVRRFRKYRDDGSGRGLWHMGETYEIIEKSDEAIVTSDKVTDWSVIKLDPKYNITAEVSK